MTNGAGAVEADVERWGGAQEEEGRRSQNYSRRRRRQECRVDVVKCVGKCEDLGRSW
jgi:hypothetical protein